MIDFARLLILLGSLSIICGCMSVAAPPSAACIDGWSQGKDYTTALVDENTPEFIAAAAQFGDERLLCLHTYLDSNGDRFFIAIIDKGRAKMREATTFQIDNGAIVIIETNIIV